MGFWKECDGWSGTKSWDWFVSAKIKVCEWLLGMIVIRFGSFWTFNRTLGCEMTQDGRSLKQKRRRGMVWKRCKLILCSLGIHVSDLTNRQDLLRVTA